MLETFQSKALKRVNRSPWFVCPAPQNVGPRLLHLFPDAMNLLIALDRTRAAHVHGWVVSAYRNPPDLHDNVLPDVAPAHQPVRHLDSDRVVDAWHHLDLVEVQILLVPDYADDGLEFSGRDVGSKAGRFNLVDDQL